MGFQVKGNLVDVFNHRIFPAEMSVDNGKIAEIRELSEEFALPAAFILPGFVDAHVHIESSMLVPSEFARLAVVHGTVATVSDPHEIANVCGLAGVEFMIKNGRTVPFKFNFGAPSCVPATIFETAGAVLDSGAVEKLLRKPEIAYLSEMMNFPGVLGKDEEVMKKIAAAARLSKPVDGHAPGLRGEQAKQYISAGISTDHECFTEEEALDKLKYGMKILIREGSAAKNFDALAGLIEKYPAFTMLCSDDKHPDSLVRGHINQLCARAVAKGIGIFPILQAACVNPVQHYKLPVGLLRVNDPADFILVRDLKDFQAIQTYIDGKLVAENGRSLIQTAKPGSINHFGCSLKNLSDFAFSETNFPANQMNGTIEVIEALDGQLITNKLSCNKKDLVAPGGSLQSNTGKDILKIVVVNRYRDSPVAKSFIHNLGLKKGAIASSVAHDSHNIVAAGVDDENICRAVNLIIAQRGGISCVVSGTPDSKEERENERVLPLPVAGLMSDGDGYQVATEYTAIDAMAKSLGCRMSAPFMTLSFMALLVIPHLKLSDLGLFDADQFKLL